MLDYHFKTKVWKLIRAFFDEAGYYEIDTPLLSKHLIPESCLEVFKTERIFPAGSKKEKEELYLIPSPEIYMKKIIAENKKSIYQICRCFRNGESEGAIHSPEFTMLEYYTMNADYLDSILITEKLFDFLSGCLKTLDLHGINALKTPFLRMTINEAFIKYAGFDLFNTVENKSLAEKARGFGIINAENLTVQVLYDLIFVAQVEPNLPKDIPVVLMDYPAFVPTLAELNNGGKTRQRFELYVNGIELANCYSEERSPENVKLFFEKETAEKKRGAVIEHKVDYNYYKIFSDFPRCSGAAMGLDRLLMIIKGENKIDLFN